MNYLELDGISILSDIEEIKKAIDEDINAVFVFTGTSTLYDYINDLYNKGDGLDADYLYKFKICYEKKNLSISYSSGNRNRTIDSMSSLINELDRESTCRIVIENDSRVELAFVVQQLIYIDYPLEMVDILLKHEEVDADKTKRFMKNVDGLLYGCETAISRLNSIKSKIELESDIDSSSKDARMNDVKESIDSCLAIRDYIKEALDVELKFAVAASKKAGKSVIVNCFLGEQVAPTSTELATPNNCFYKKSPDNKYHLQLEGKPAQEFDSRNGIYDEINRYFRAAQNDEKDGFGLPDMHINYVTDENNFSSYTIFDTAGPDAAGTTHAKAADKAMQMCDVAVFAIDYAKYLTTSEENYLRRVKKMFEDQNKFHSLIFALNKIDVRYTDADSPKSFVMSVDFLKTRLANIDDAYKDCIIFPTCSLEYFSAIEAEKAGVSELKTKVPIEQMKKIKFDNKRIKSLQWLHTHAENLEYYHGIDSVSYDVFKKDSGMPALMSYVSYVAQSKARHEIVNHVNYEIDLQRMNIKSILEHINYIETLINTDDEKIKDISTIIEDYSKEVEPVLSNHFDKKELELLDDNSLLKMFEGDYEQLFDYQKKSIKDKYSKNVISKHIYDKAIDEMWKKIEQYRIFGEISGREIENLFTKNDLKNIANNLAVECIQETAGEIHKQSQKVNREVKCIVDKRKEILQKKSEECRERLLKENIDFKLLVFPEFEFSARMCSPGEIIVSMDNVDFKLYDSLSNLFEVKIFKNIGTWLSKVFGQSSQKDYKRKLPENKYEFKNSCDKQFKDKLKVAVYENNLEDKIGDAINKYVVDQYMGDLIKEIRRTFEDINNGYNTCINRFRTDIDDREKYKLEIEEYNKRKTTIIDIDNSTKDFMSIWNAICNDMIEETNN